VPDRILRGGLLSTAQIKRALIKPLRASERKQPRISLADSRDIIAMIVGLFESARTGKPVIL